MSGASHTVCCIFFAEFAKLLKSIDTVLIVTSSRMGWNSYRTHVLQSLPFIYLYTRPTGDHTLGRPSGRLWYRITHMVHRHVVCCRGFGGNQFNRFVVPPQHCYCCCYCSRCGYKISGGLVLRAISDRWTSRVDTVTSYHSCTLHHINCTTHDSRDVIDSDCTKVYLVRRSTTILNYTRVMCVRACMEFAQTFLTE